MSIPVDVVLALALRSRQVLDAVGEAIRSDLVVANPFQRQIGGWADDFLTRSGRLPSTGDLMVWLQNQPPAVRDGCVEAWGRLQVVDVSAYDPIHFVEHLVPWLRGVAARTAASRLQSLSEVTPETLITMASKVESITTRSLRGLARLSDIDTWATTPREDEYTPTGLASLDRLIGGWGKELWIVFADSGVGKSMMLQNWVTAAALRGRRCLHVTLELGLRPQIHRYYRQIATVEREVFASDLPTVKSRLSHWFRLAQGEVYLIEFPAHGLTPEELHRVLARVQRHLGSVDILALDYLDLLAPPEGGRGRDAYADLGHLTHAVRAYCPAYDLTVLTPSQAVRRPEKRDRLTVRDMGDSYQKVRGVDGLLSLIQTPEEEEVHQGRLGVLKVRDSGGRGTEIPLYINREMSVLAALDHPNTIELMTRLGHLPGAPAPQGLLAGAGMGGTP